MDGIEDGPARPMYGCAPTDVSSSYLTKVNEEDENEMTSFYKDLVHNAHGLLHKQDSEIRRLKKLLLEKKERVSLQQEEEENSDPGLSAPPCRPGGDKEGRDALTVFPDEIWRIFLDKFVAPEDLYSCYLTCTLFSEILEPAKSQWLFQKIFPLIYHHLGKPDILNCRATCKRWMTAVDHRIDNNIESSFDVPYNSIQVFFKNYLRGYPPIFALFNFPSLAGRHSGCDSLGYQLLKLNPAMELHPRNPFLGRTLSILDFFSSPSFVNDALGFLDKVGQHIYYLIIWVPEDLVPNALPFTYVLNQCLEKTPKLKSLSLDLNSLLPSRENVPALCCPSSVETLIIQQSPGYLDLINNIPGEEIDMFADVLVSPLSQQLVHLEAFWSQRFVTFQWPALKELKLSFVTSEQTLLELLHIHLPALQSLQIIFSPDMTGRTELAFHHLLKLTNHFAELTSLELGNLRAVLNDTQGATPLPPDLYSSSKLTTLKVLQHILQCKQWHTFLLRFRFLKYLYIQNDGGRRPEERWTWYPTGWPSSSSTHYDGKEIFTAPIWKMLPSLQVIVYRYGDTWGNDNNCAYTREGYMMRSVPTDDQ